PCSDSQTSHTVHYTSRDQSGPLPPDPSKFFGSHRPAHGSAHRTLFVCCLARRRQSACAQFPDPHKLPRSRAAQKNRPFRFHPRQNAARTFPARALPHSQASPRPESSAPAQTARTLPRPCPAPAPLALSRKQRRSVYFFDQKKLYIPSAIIKILAYRPTREALLPARS